MLLEGFSFLNVKKNLSFDLFLNFSGRPTLGLPFSNIVNLGKEQSFNKLYYPQLAYEHVPSNVPVPVV